MIGIKVFHLYRNAYKGILSFQFLGAVVGYLIGSFIPNNWIAFIASGITYVAVAFGGYLWLGKNDAETRMLQKFISKLKVFGR